MYNYYTDLKKKKEQEELEEKIKKKEENRLRRKKKMDRLVNQYEERIKNFVFQMAEKPIVVKKKDEKILSSRQELLFETSDKILSKKGFVFTNYKTDKERVDEYLKSKNKIYHSDYYSANNHSPRGAISTFFKTSNQLIQPSMRFKPRTDLERVYDTLLERNGGMVDSNLKAQVEKMVTKNTQIRSGSSSSEDEEDTRKRRVHNKIIAQRNEMIKQRKQLASINNMKRRMESTDAKFFRSDLQNKTHFKAVENLTMFKTSTMNHQLFKTFSKEDIDNQKKFLDTRKNFYSTITNGFGRGKPKFRRTKHLIKSDSQGKGIAHTEGNFSLIGNKKILNDLEITKEIANSNPLLFNMNFNSIKADTNSINATAEQMNQLRALAFEYYPEEEAKELKELMKGEVYDEYKKDQNITIDGKEYKKTDLDKIADKVLTKCNWNEKKMKYNKTGEGKLMFTNGLTLTEFERKYGLLP